MNILGITAGLATRIRRCPPMQQVYELPPAGPPEVPCVVIEFPIVTSYHNDMAHQLSRVGVGLKVMLGRGDAEGAYRQFAELLSTEGANSLIRALEDPGVPDPLPWHRIAVRTSDVPRDEGDNITVSLTLDLDA